MHNLIYLNNLEAAALDPYVRLNEAQLSHAMKPGMFVAESPKVIERALRAGYQPASLLMEKRVLDRDLADLDHEMITNGTADLGQTPIYVVDSTQIRQLAGYNMLRGALAAMCRMARPDLFDFLAALPTDHPRIAVLERVVNPANIGAIFRSAAALGIDGVVVTSDIPLIPSTVGPRGWRWGPSSRYHGPMLTPRPGRPTELVSCIDWVTGQRPWPYVIIPLVSLIPG